ncbi:hypothetical protein SOVF_031850 isoform A [Spinacia oleracea]|uniref:Uncharacterized protein isoform X3 n=1 Tax=Spinacia oleracea TaxID=3562 RepID=A0A9R0IE15_SPIOL|nr:uncharacterized protein LOC110786182 isoform X3 [Spinacia oleracea]KNA22719.1 hypothetical protein SOVF_031850 isoform A [Spinacia oleracea]
MTFGKDAPPLPMYERKVLRHVPTMVRRRYDRDLDNKLDDTIGLPSKGGESQNDDEVVPDANPASVIDVDDFVDDEDDDDLHSHFEDEQDTQILCVKHFGSSAKDNKSESGGAEEANLASIMNVNVEDKIEDDAQFENDEDMQVEDDKSEYDGTKDANVTTNYVEDSDQDEVEDKDHENSDNSCLKDSDQDEVKDNDHKFVDNKQDVQVEDNKSENDGTKDANIANNYVEDSDQDEVEDKDHEKFDNNYVEDSDQDKVEDKDHENFDNKQVEDNKSEDDGIKSANVANNYVEVEDSDQDKVNDKDHEKFDKKYVEDSDQDEVQDKDHENFDNKQDVQVEDNKNVDDGTKCANVANNYVKDSVKAEVEDNDHDNSNDKQDIQVEDSKSEGDETKDVDVASNYMDAMDEIEDKNRGNSDDKKDIQGKDNKIEGDGTKNTNIVRHRMDICAKDDDLNIEPENFDNKQGFSPKAFKKTLERKDYDLCCPNCKNYITHTMIFRRREECQQEKTTCYSFLIDLLSCIRG